MKFAHCFAITAAGFLAACASTDVGKGQASTASGMNAVPSAGLEPQTLEVGECGLFLWSLSGEPTFMFFSRATSGEARILIEDEAETVTQASAGGDIFGQFTTQTGWSSQTKGYSIDLTLVPGEQLIDGQRVESGRIKLTDIEGWETIIPIAGARACLNEPDPAAMSLQ